MVLRLNNKLRNIYSRKSTKIQLQKLRVRGIWTKTSSGRQSVHSRLLQLGTVGSLSLPAPSQRAFYISHPAPSYLLLRLGPGQVQWNAGGSLLYLTPISGFVALPWMWFIILRPQQPGETSQENLKLLSVPLPPKCWHPKSDYGHTQSCASWRG